MVALSVALAGLGVGGVLVYQDTHPDLPPMVSADPPVGRAGNGG